MVYSNSPRNTTNISVAIILPTACTTSLVFQNKKAVCVLTVETGNIGLFYWSSILPGPVCRPISFYSACCYNPSCDIIISGCLSHITTVLLTPGRSTLHDHGYDSAHQHRLLQRTC